ncbi:MAG: hypothetical protein E6K82_04310 [Candidatus Rokuibacteriota bacterium]|nr:MAG: hypothetical protein E6K82_04310 [Candidatus Rokubacteria bacterium]
MSEKATPLEDKIRHALNEGRILILGTQVLLGFHYRAVLEPRFEHLPAAGQALAIIGLGLLLLAFGLLVAPVAYHRIVERGAVSTALHRLTTLAVGAALLPLAFAFAIGGWVVAERVAVVPPAAAAVLVLALTLGCWYALPLAARRRLKTEGETMAERQDIPLRSKIEQTLTEVRMVLPGAQALLGFGFAAILLDSFDHLPTSSQLTHLVGLGFIMLATILLMTPASRHRIAERGEDTEDFHRFTSRMLLLAMAALALGLSAQVFVVVRRVYDALPVAGAAAGGALVFFVGFWFGLTAWIRARQPASAAGARPAAGREAA